MDKLQPCLDYAESGNLEDYRLGKQRISEGKVGCMIVAGGQGTRLGFEGPKGMFPINNKSLFQIFAEKTVAAGRDLPLAIMTSPLNDEITKEFFAKNNFFGMKQDQLYFFTQKMLPFLDTDGNMLSESGPDGNGNSLRYFCESGIWQKWKSMGVEQINFILVDNPLADPFDAELAGYHYRTNADATLKCVLRKNPEEKVGVIAKMGDKIAVIEYSELSVEEAKKYPLANISLFCFSMDFIQKCASHPLPYHAAFKSNVWKRETFIFDNLKIATNVNLLLYPRSECFAPLKDKASISEVQKALT